MKSRTPVEIKFNGSQQGPAFFVEQWVRSDRLTSPGVVTTWELSSQAVNHLPMGNCKDHLLFVSARQACRIESLVCTHKLLGAMIELSYILNSLLI